ncbi:MAG: hypothetical protein K8L99_01675 [Anaerolineae bacterium]|nr:hypothetical protein [Anaerolineae bacterium]
MSYFTAKLQQENAQPEPEETKPNFKATGTRTLRLLIASLQIENKWSNIQAINDLIAIGKPAVPYLITALDNRNPRVWRLASVALVKIGADANDELVEALQHESQQVRLLAAAVLKKIGSLRPGEPGYVEMWGEYQKLVRTQSSQPKRMLRHEKKS